MVDDFKSIIDGIKSSSVYPGRCSDEYVYAPSVYVYVFNLSFKVITRGKIGLWKGELKIKGFRGGSFSVWVVGETGSEDTWYALYQGSHEV
jgi:hypothetical protein